MFNLKASSVKRDTDYSLESIRKNVSKTIEEFSLLTIDMIRDASNNGSYSTMLFPYTFSGILRSVQNKDTLYEVNNGILNFVEDLRKAGYAVTYTEVFNQRFEMNQVGTITIDWSDPKDESESKVVVNV